MGSGRTSDYENAKAVLDRIMASLDSRLQNERTHDDRPLDPNLT